MVNDLLATIEKRRLSVGEIAQIEDEKVKREDNDKKFSAMEMKKRKYIHNQHPDSTRLGACTKVEQDIGAIMCHEYRLMLCKLHLQHSNTMYNNS